VPEERKICSRKVSIMIQRRSRNLLNGNEINTGAMKTEGSIFICLRRARSSKLVYYFYFSAAWFLLVQRACYFLCLETKKVTKENSRLQIILGLLFFDLPTQYNSLIPFAQTVLLTLGPRSKPQNTRFNPKLSEAI
jgi:hypothetical protein